MFILSLYYNEENNMAKVVNNEKQDLLEKGEYWHWAEKERSPRLDYLRKAY